MAYRKYGRTTRKGGVRKTRAAGRRAYTRRRRVSGGVGAIDTKILLGVVLGAVAGKFLDKVIPDTLDSKIAAAAKIGVGIALPLIAPKGKMDTLISGTGYGIAAEGVVSLLKDFGVVSGLGGLGSADTCQIRIAPSNNMISSAASVLAQSSSGTVPIVNGVGEIAAGGTVYTEGNFNEVPIISGLDEDYSTDDY
jgi:hypothetical protein